MEINAIEHPAAGNVSDTGHAAAAEDRFTEFILPPLTFAEYLLFAGQESALIVPGPPQDDRAPSCRATDIHGLNVEFVNYLNYGGFPEAVMNPAVRVNPSRFLRQDVVNKVLLKDLPSLYGIGDTQELNRFFNVLAFHTGNEIGLENLSKHSGISKTKLNDYLEYLEAAFLIRRVHRIDDDAMGNLAETAVWSQWLHSAEISRSLHYALSAPGRTSWL